MRNLIEIVIGLVLLAIGYTGMLYLFSGIVESLKGPTVRDLKLAAYNVCDRERKLTREFCVIKKVGEYCEKNKNLLACKRVEGMTMQEFQNE